MIYLYATLLSVGTFLCLGITLLGLPGNWLIVIAAAVYAWLLPVEISWWVVGIALLLAVLGEIVEFVAGMLGSRSAGGSRWGAGGAFLGGILGAVVGTLTIPIPILGTLIGACLGAGLGAWSMEVSKSKRTNHDALRIATGASVGQLIGTLTKLCLGLTIWLMITVAAYWR